MVPIHFDTFINSDDPLGHCPAALKRDLARRGPSETEVVLLNIGEQRVLIPR